MYGKNAEDYYKGLQPEFQSQSNGIGKQYLLDNIEDILERNYVTYKGIKQAIPRYYIKLIMKYGSPLELTNFKQEQINARITNTADRANDYLNSLSEKDYERLMQKIHDAPECDPLREKLDLERIAAAKQMDLNLKSHQKIKTGMKIL